MTTNKKSVTKKSHKPTTTAKPRKLTRIGATLSTTDNMMTKNSKPKKGG